MDAINLNLDGKKGLQAYGPLNNPDDEFRTQQNKLSRIGLDGDKESLCAEWVVS